MKRIAIIGSQGVPANYGGFESLVENLIPDADARELHYTVFCGGKDYEKHIPEYNGATLKYVPLHANGAQSVIYDVISLLLCIGRGFDCILVLGVSGCLFLPFVKLLFRGRIVVNIDGLEHRRNKWGRFSKWFLLTSEAVAVRCADTVVADNRGIQEYVRKTYGKDAELIAYGGDHAIMDVPAGKIKEILSDYGLEAGRYAVSVCRIEPENNCHIILESFRGREESLVFVGNWDRSEYGRNLRKLYSNCPNILTLDAIYDRATLYALRSNAALYIHGHSAGGTNPSLVEAMHFGIPIVAFDVIYNRETTENGSFYFRTPADIAAVLDDMPLSGNCGEKLKETARREYVWSRIVARYEKVFTCGSENVLKQ